MFLNNFDIHDFVLKIPVEKGLILIDFFSGNILFLEKGIYSIDNNMKIQMNKLGFIDNGKISILEEKWKETYMKNKPFTCVVENVNSLECSEKINILLQCINRKINNNKINIKLIIDNEIPSTFLDNLSFSNTIKHVTITYWFRSIQNLRDKNVLRDIEYQIMKHKSADLLVNAILTLKFPNELIDNFNIIRRLISEFDIPIFIEINFNKEDKVEKILDFVDVIYKNQIYALTQNIYVLPPSITTCRRVFNCTYNIDQEFYKKMFKLIIEKNLNGLIFLSGGSVFTSLQFFLDTELYVPPAFLRCEAGNSIYIREQNLIYCANDNNRDCNLYDEKFEENIINSINRFRNTQLLYTKINKNNYQTYGGVCPFKNLDKQRFEIEQLISCFMNEYIVKKGSGFY